MLERTGNRLLVWALLLPLVLINSQVLAGDPPQQVIKKVVDDVLADLSAHKAEVKADPSVAYQLVDAHVMPHVDMSAVSRSVLGKYWRRASKAERAEFKRQFRILLKRTYGVALAAYTDQKVEYLPNKLRDGDKTNLVKLKILQPGGPPVPVGFAMYLKKGEWKMYDFKVQGISLVQNYRSSFKSIIRRKGMPGLLDELKAKNQG